MSSDIKPCPFCGAQPEYLSVPGGMWVRCPNCGASSDDSGALEKWNRRVPQPDNLIAALRDIVEATDPDDPESYRSDDREGCLDAVQAIALKALETGGRMNE